MILADSNSKKVLIGLTLVFGFWLLLVYGPLIGAIEIWISNEIYNHCLIVIPASIYLIYEKRKVIKWSEASMSWLAAIVFILQLLFYVLATAADIQLFQHVAIFSMLPTLFWLFAGNRIAWSLRFPLLFVLFAVPVGEELIPFLQEITADISVWMLELSGIPLFRSGLFIEIPQGKFLVAEACSGVSFLIASIVLGNLYAYMNLVTMRRRIFFVILSILFPIFANAVRVYGIIYIGYSTEMEHAVGADHLIYGWFFFAFVLVCLFLIGELIRKREVRSLRNRFNETIQEENATVQDSSSNIESFQLNANLTILGVTVVAIMLASIQTFRMNNVEFANTEPFSIDTSDFQKKVHSHAMQWVPRYVENTKQERFHLTHSGFDFDLFYAFYDGSSGELASSLNRLYEQDRWTLVDRSRVDFDGNTILKEDITTSIGLKKTIFYWYVVDGEVISTFRDVKLQQLVTRLKGEQFRSAVIAVSIDYEQDEKLDDEKSRVIVELVLSKV